MSRITPFPIFAVAGLLAGCVPPPPPMVVQPMVVQPMVVQAAPRPVLLPSPVVVSYPPIPAPRVEVIPAPPPRRREVMVWQPGHWHWDGYRYEWLGGRYTERLVGTTHWVPGHWVPRPGGYAWERGHWA